MGLDYNWWDTRINLRTSTLKSICREDKDIIMAFTRELVYTVNTGGRLYMIGNGGSAADCDHIIGEFRGKFLKNRRAINAFSLMGSTASVTAIANDFGYEELFKRQLDGILKYNDSVIALSTSGKSKNLLNFNLTKNNSLIITGYVNNVIDTYRYHLQVPISYSKETVPVIQECTMFLLHTMCEIFDIYFGSENDWE